MATKYPEEIQTFPKMQDITVGDAALVKQYQEAMQSGDFAGANAILRQIPEYATKIVTADLLNTVDDTVVALQREFNLKYNPSITISKDRPANMQEGDYWWEVVD